MVLDGGPVRPHVVIARRAGAVIGPLAIAVAVILVVWVVSAVAVGWAVVAAVATIACRSTVLRARKRLVARRRAQPLRSAGLKDRDARRCASVVRSTAQITGGGSEVTVSARTA